LDAEKFPVSLLDVLDYIDAVAARHISLLHPKRSGPQPEASWS
jgi:hypothetical protein